LTKQVPAESQTRPSTQCPETRWETVYKPNHAILYYIITIIVLSHEERWYITIKHDNESRSCSGLSLRLQYPTPL